MKTTIVAAPNLFSPSLIIAAGRGEEAERGKEFLPLPHQAQGRRKEQGYIRALRSILTEPYSEKTGVQLVWGRAKGHRNHSSALLAPCHIAENPAWLHKA